MSGGGDKKHIEKFNTPFMDRLRSEKPLLFIPIAMDGVVPYNECVEWVKSVFVPLGINGIEMWTDLKNKKLTELSDFSALYIGGGNTFSLLKNIRESGFDELLKAYIEEGGTVFGSSAGAIILGEGIGTCAHLDENGVGLKDFTGLSLAHGNSVWCHYSPEDDVLIERYIFSNGNPVLALSEKTGAILEGGIITVTGTLPAFQFHQKGEGVMRQRIEPNEAVNFLKGAGSGML